MLFPVRLVFWLGLTYSAMGWPSDTPAPDAGDLAASAARLCAAHPRVCIEAAEAAAGVAGKPEPVAPARPAAHKKVDTLAPADRATPWKGKG